MPIQSAKNLYRGVNVHLMSLLQNEPGEWESFHAEHIIHLRDSIETELPPYYIAQGERSLQIREGEDERRRPERTVPDVTIVQMRQSVERFGRANIFSDPRPTLDEGQMAIYGFSVGDAIPIVDIPLADKDVLTFDFGAAYNRTYEAKRFHAQFVDYEQLPDRFDTYSATDQEMIKRLIQTLSESQPKA